MNGFGFIEYKDAMDARDVVPGTYSRLYCHLTMQIDVSAGVIPCDIFLSCTC